MFRKILCFIGFHVSNNDYGMKGLGGTVFSNCEHCNTEITHKKLWWFGGGN